MLWQGYNGPVVVIDTWVEITDAVEVPQEPGALRQANQGHSHHLEIVLCMHREPSNWTLYMDVAVYPSVRLRDLI